MAKLWGAANVRICGGAADSESLRNLSELIGDDDRPTRTVSTRESASLFGSAYSTSYQLTREKILDVAALAALPKGRAVVLSSGNRPALVETMPWMSGAYADQVRASIAAHDPQAVETLADASTRGPAGELTPTHGEADTLSVWRAALDQHSQHRGEK